MHRQVCRLLTIDRKRRLDTCLDFHEMANDELAFIARIIIADEICVDEDEKTLDSVKETQ